MNKQRILKRLSALAVSGTILAAPALYGVPNDRSSDKAADRQWSQTEHDAKMHSSKEKSASLKSNEHSLSKLIGATVNDSEGNKIGEIDDLIINQSSNQAKFAVVKTDDILDNQKALVPLSELKRDRSEPDSLMSDSDELAFTLNISEERFDELANVEFDQQDLSGTIEQALDSIRDAFTGDYASAEIRGSSFRLASELQDASPARGSNQISSVDEVAVNLEEDGEIHFILSDNSGESYRVPANEVEINRDGRIELSAATRLNEYDTSSASYRFDRDARDAGVEAEVSSGVDRVQHTRSSWPKVQNRLENDEQAEDQSNPTRRQSSNLADRDDDTWRDESSQPNKESDSDYRSQSTDQTSPSGRAYGATSGASDESEESAVRRGGQEYSSSTSSDRYDSNRSAESRSGLSSERDASRAQSGQAAEGRSESESAYGSASSSSESKVSESEDDRYMSAKRQWDEGKDFDTISDPNSIVGMKVRDRDGETIGQISDVLIRQDSGDIAYFVVESDDWTNKSSGLVPVQSAQRGDSSSAQSQSRNQASSSSAQTNQSGQQQAEVVEVVVLGISEDEFQRSADYDASSDANSYASEKRSDIARTHGVSEDELPDRTIILISAAEQNRNESNQNQDRSGSDQSRNR